MEEFNRKQSRPLSKEGGFLLGLPFLRTTCRPKSAGMSPFFGSLWGKKNPETRESSGIWKLKK